MSANQSGLQGFHTWLIENCGRAAGERLHAEAQAELDRLMGLRARGPMAHTPAPAGYTYLRRWLESTADLALPELATSSDLAAVASLEPPHRETVYLLRRYGMAPSQLRAARGRDLRATVIQKLTLHLAHAGHFPAMTVELDQEGAGVLWNLIAWGMKSPVGTPAPHANVNVRLLLTDDDFLLREKPGRPMPRKLHQLWYSVALGRACGALEPTYGHDRNGAKLAEASGAAVASAAIV